MEKQEFRYTTLWQDDVSKIIFATYTPKLEVNIEIAHELVQNRMTFSKGEPHYILIDLTNMKSITKEAREYMNSTDGGLKGIVGGAFLSNNIAAAVLVNLYLKINKPTVPAKFFTKRQEALNWLIELKKKNKGARI